MGEICINVWLITDSIKQWNSSLSIDKISAARISDTVVVFDLYYKCIEGIKLINQKCFLRITGNTFTEASEPSR